MKKVLLMVLALAMVFGLASCKQAFESTELTFKDSLIAQGIDVTVETVNEMFETELMEDGVAEYDIADIYKGFYYAYGFEYMARLPELFPIVDLPEDYYDVKYSQSTPQVTGTLKVENKLLDELGEELDDKLVKYSVDMTIKGLDYENEDWEDLTDPEFSMTISFEVENKMTVDAEKKEMTNAYKVKNFKLNGKAYHTMEMIVVMNTETGEGKQTMKYDGRKYTTSSKLHGVS